MAENGNGEQLPNGQLAGRNRGAGRRFVKGESGNPGGMSRDAIMRVREARRLALSYAPRAIRKLASLLDSEDERVVVAAAEGLLDRAGLKPYSTEPELQAVVTATVDVETMRSLLAARLTALAAQREEHAELP